MLDRLRALFLSDDPDVRVQGVELLRSLDDPSLFDAMLQGTAHATVPLYEGGGQADVIVPGQYFHAVRLDHRSALRSMCWQVLAAAPAQSAFASLRDRIRVVQLRESDLGGPVDLGLLSLPEGLRVLHIHTTHPITRLGGLRRFTQLESLKIASCKLPEGLDAIADMPGLRSLDVQWVTVTASSQPLTMPDLETLTIAGFASLSLSAMRLPSLHTLSLNNYPDRDLAALQNLPSLRVLDVSLNAANCSLHGIAALPSLQRLRFTGSNLQTLKPLASLSELRALQLGELSAACDVSCLAQLGSLRELHVATVTSPLAAALRTRSLESFSCGGLGPDVDLSFLGQSAALTSPLFLTTAPTLRTLEGLHPDAKVPSLRVESSPELDTLGAVPSALRELYLNFAPKLRDLRGLEHARDLEALTVLRAHALHDLAALASLTTLKRLTLHDAAALTDVSVLASLPALEEVSLKGATALSDISALARCPSLKAVLLGPSGVDRKLVPRELLGRCSWDQKITLEQLLARIATPPAAPLASAAPAADVPRVPRVVVAAEHREKLAGLALRIADTSTTTVVERVRKFMADATPAFWAAALSQWMVHPPTDKKPFGEIAVRSGLSAAARSRVAPLACLALLRHCPDEVAEKAALRDRIDALDLPYEANLAEIPPLPKLARLSGHFHHANDLDSLAAPASLRALHLFFGEKLAPPALDAMTGLESLTLEGEIAALPTGLAGRASLRELSLDAHVDRPSLDLGGCVGLESLSLRGLHQKALPAWEKLASLKHLTLDGIRQLELGGLVALTALESLTLHEIARLRDLSALAKLTGLRRVVIERCPFVEDLSPLVALPALESVTLKYARFRQIPTTPGLEGKLNVG